MANGHGGYRKPSNPAPVSGPGKYSRRTDGKANMMDLPDAAYGENAAFREAQAGAPMGGGGGGGIPASVAPPREIVPLGAPSQQPDVPVTSGAEYGPGPGMGALGLGPGQLDREQYGKYMPFFMKLANDPETPKSVRTMIRQMFADS